LRDGGRFSILYWRREADEKITGALTAIERDMGEDGLEGEDGSEEGDLLGDSRASRS
jgi:hypothetical protein